MDISHLSPVQREFADKIIIKCIRSREYFIRNILQVTHIEDWQLEVIRALDGGVDKISIRSGHGVGKTCLISWLAIHFLLFKDDTKVIVTSPSFSQLTDGLIPEISKWVSRMPEWMSSQVVMTKDRMTRLPATKNNFISFRTARKDNPEALAGVHAENVMLLVDEASGVPENVYEVGQGMLSTKGAVALLIGNPTRPNGFFYKTHNELSDLWWTKKVSCLDSSRVDASYIASQLRTYGPDSREYAVRVLGDFPASGEDSIIPRAFVMQAAKCLVSEVKAGGTYWGVDVGRGGDPSAFVERVGNTLTEYRELRYVDLMQVAGWVKTRWDATLPSLRPDNILVDSIGLGAGVADRLLELNLPVIAVNVSSVPAAADRYQNLRAELWFKAREWFAGKNVNIVKMEGLNLLIEELSSLNQIFMSSGKMAAESKRDAKARGIPSPNLADAVCLTFAYEGAVLSGSYASQGRLDDALSDYTAPHVV